MSNSHDVVTFFHLYAPTDQRVLQKHRTQQHYSRASTRQTECFCWVPDRCRACPKCHCEVVVAESLNHFFMSGQTFWLAKPSPYALGVVKMTAMFILHTAPHTKIYRTMINLKKVFYYTNVFIVIKIFYIWFYSCIFWHGFPYNFLWRMDITNIFFASNLNF